jgi:cytidylate kinase
MENYIITIGRQLGSGGKIIGDSLAGKLGIACYDKELINIASKESGLCAEFFERADEKGNFSIIDSLFGYNSGYMGHGSNYLCNETLFKIQSDVIRTIAGRESCIFVGRCADYILRNSPRLLRVFITADLDDRILRLTSLTGVSPKEAAMKIDQTDKKRASYYNYYSNRQWGSAASYDLCINSSTNGIERCADIIESCIKDKFTEGTES